MTGRVKVFLSYRRADTQHVAGRAADRLGEVFELFMDMDTIPPGVDFTDYVRRAVGNCDVLLAFIGEKWLTLAAGTGGRRIDDPQDWVVQEITAALHRGVPVIPVLVDDAIMPSTSELPTDLAPLANRQAVALRYSSFSADLTRLMAGIDHAGGDHAAASPASPEAAQPLARASAVTEPFAERWERTPVPAAPPVAISIPESKPPSRRRGLLIGALLIVVAAVLGAVIAIVRPFSSGAGGAASTATTGGGSPTAAVSSPHPTLTPAATAEQLRARVPPSYRETCSTLTPEPAVLRAGLRVAVQCVPGPGTAAGRAPEYSYFFQYGAVSAATAAFRGYYAAGSAPDGDCTTGPAERTYQRPGVGGTLRCYQDADGYRVFAWTADELGILASVADRTMSYAELADWWLAAGPIR